MNVRYWENDSASVYSRSYKFYVTLLLTIIYVFNQVDRAVFGFLMEPIRAEFGLSDIELGLLAGPALVIFYAVLGVPIARRADRSDRVNIMSVAVAVWSVIVAAGALVGNFWQLAVVRIGVGVGEAGFAAIAQSIIGGYHGSAERTRALSIFMLAIPFGGVVSSLLAGWTNEAFGWRAVFLVAGLPGLALAVLLKLTVQEPPKIAEGALTDSQPQPIVQIASAVWRHAPLRNLCIAMTLLNIVTASAATWLPTFFMREQHLGSGLLGTWLALATGSGAIVGAGASWWFAGLNLAMYRQLRILALASVMLAPLLLGVLLVSNAKLALVLLIPTYVLKAFLLGPLWSLLQGLSPAGDRATVTAVVIFFQTLAAGVLAAPLVGGLSDLSAASFGGNGLSMALTTVFLCAPWASLHMGLASRAAEALHAERDAGFKASEA